MVCSGAQAPIFFNYMYAFVHVCVSASTHACACLPWRSRDHLQEVLVSFHHVVARIKLRLSGLACTLIGWAFLLALFKFIFNQKLFFFLRERGTLCVLNWPELSMISLKRPPLILFLPHVRSHGSTYLEHWLNLPEEDRCEGPAHLTWSCVCCTLTSLKVNVASRAGEIAQR